MNDVRLIRYIFNEEVDEGKYAIKSKAFVRILKRRKRKLKEIKETNITYNK